MALEDMMRVLVTGGTGLVGRAVACALRDAGHAVRVIARHAPDSPLASVDGVEYREADLTDPPSLAGCCDACEVVVHAGAVVHAPRSGPTLTDINVGGTAALLDEALRAGVRRIVHISSLGAERGASAYHRTKREAETLVRTRAHEWTILRPGNVYGPGRSHLARFVHAMRTWPVVPVPGDPDARFQPILVDDLAGCIRVACETPVALHRTIELAGPDATSIRALHDAVARLVERRPPLVPVPAALVRSGARVLDALGVDAPVHGDEVTMVAEGNLPIAEDADAVARVFGIAPTPLAEGLRRLAQATPELLPGSGVGPVIERRWRIGIAGAPDAATLMRRLTERFVDLMPSETADAATEPASSDGLRPGAMVSIALPLRGHVQVRVEAVTSTSTTCVTLAGHPLAGMVRFRTLDRPGRTEVEVCTIDHASSRLDRTGLLLGGLPLKAWTWRRFLRDVAADAGGTSRSPVVYSRATLLPEEVRALRTWLTSLARPHAARRERSADGAVRPQRR